MRAENTLEQILAIIRGIEVGGTNPAFALEEIQRLAARTLAPFHCADCDGRFTEAEIRPLMELPHLYERLTPGDTVPSGECRSCGGFCYPSDQE